MTFSFGYLLGTLLLFAKTLENVHFYIFKNPNSLLRRLMVMLLKLCCSSGTRISTVKLPRRRRPRRKNVIVVSLYQCSVPLGHGGEKGVARAIVHYLIWSPFAQGATALLPFGCHCTHTDNYLRSSAIKKIKLF